MGAIIWPFLIYWLVLFVTSYVIVDVGHDQLYDEPPPNEGLRVLVGSLLMAAMLTWIKPTFEKMFTEGLAWTVLMGIVWFLVFMFVYQFHPPHALAIGTVAMLMIPGVASMGVDSLTKPTPILTPVRSYSTQKAVRGTIGAPPAKK